MRRPACEVEVGHTIQHPDWGEVDVRVRVGVGAYDPGVSTGPIKGSYPPEGGDAQDLIGVVVDGGRHDGQKLDVTAPYCCDLLEDELLCDNAELMASEDADDRRDFEADVQYDRWKDRDL